MSSYDLIIVYYTTLLEALEHEFNIVNVSPARCYRAENYLKVLTHIKTFTLLFRNTC
jgi:hypothetical protein